jgi:ribosomal protein S18 acetylase RimI-like enzyme
MNTRPATPDDLERVLELVRTDEEHLVGRRSRVGLSDLLQWLARVDLADDTWMFEDDGRLVAFGWGETVEDLGFAIGIVHPDVKGRGIGARLVELSERRILERGGATRVQQFALAADTAAPGLFAAHGYREVRRFYEMAIELDGPPLPPVLPDDLTIEPFDEAGAREFYDALDESFRDHWEHHSTPFEEWWEQKQNAPDFDPTLWFLIREGTEIAAVARNDPNRNEGGMVSALGVRRPWRGRGLGRALLLHTFGEFQRRGVNRISLGVDSENPTGATQLYESVGMRVEQEQTIFEKPLS